MGLHRAGLQPSETLTRAMSERAWKEASESYLREASAIHDHNINVIMSEHRKRRNKIKRDGARLRLWTCPPLALVLGCIAWGDFRQPSSLHVVVGMIYALGALTSLSMLVLGAMFDRPRK